MTFIDKTIKSKYLDRDFTVSCWEKVQGEGRTLTIIEHAAFEDIIFNQLVEEALDIQYTLEPMTGIVNYPVIKCTMKDNSGRFIVEFGEAHPDSLINNISRQNPVTMAGNRAFDRAAIRYLNLEGKVYSSEEIPSDDEKKSVKKESVKPNSTQNGSSDVVIEAKGDSDIGMTVVNFGKYRNHSKTVAEIWASDETWARKIVEMELDNCGEATKRQIMALKQYKGA